MKNYNLITTLLLAIMACEPGWKEINPDGPEPGTTKEDRGVQVAVTTPNGVPFTYAFNGEKETRVWEGSREVHLWFSSEFPQELVLRNDGEVAGELSVLAFGDHRMSIRDTPWSPTSPDRVQRMGVFLQPNFPRTLWIQGHFPGE